MWKKALSVMLALGVAASMLAIGLTALAEEPTLDDPGTDQVYLVNSTTKDQTSGKTYTYANLEEKPGEHQMRVDGSNPARLMYVSGRDCFATVDTYDIGDLESVSVWVANATNQAYVPIFAYAMDDDKELRQIGSCAIMNKPDDWTAVEGKMPVWEEAKALNIQTPSRIYFKTAAPLNVHIEKIVITGQELGTREITFTPNTVETVDGQTKTVQHNFVTVSGLAPNAAGWAENDVDICGEMAFTFQNVDFQDGLTNIKAKWGTIGPGFTHGDGYMEVYAVQRDTGRAYRIGKLHLPEYTATVNWSDYAGGFSVSHFTWDDESDRERFTGRWDVKMVYKPSISTDNIHFGGVYFYAQGEASAADENGADLLTSFTNYDRILNTYIREDMVSNAADAWEDYAAVQQQAHAVAQDINIRLEAWKLYDEVGIQYAQKLAEGSNGGHPNYAQYNPLWLAYDGVQLKCNDSYAAVADVQAAMDTLKQAIVGLEPDAVLPDTQPVYDVNLYRVIKYDTQLREAFDTLTFYLEDLADAVAEAEAIEEGQYTDESWQALQAAVQTGNGVLDQVVIDSGAGTVALPAAADVRTALTELLAARDGLETYVDILTERTNTYKETYQDGKYTTATWNAFATAMNAADDVLDKGEAATKAELKTALNDLETAKEALVRMDKPLSEKVEATKADYATQGKYTDETWAALQEALTAAETVIGKTANTEQEVTDAVAAIDAAVQALDKVDDALRAMVAEVTVTYPAQGEYTDEAWADLTAALDAAKALLEQEVCTQEEALAAMAALDAAVTGLTTGETPIGPGTDGEDPETPGDGDEQPGGDDDSGNNDDPENGDQLDDDLSGESGSPDELPPPTGVAISLAAFGLLVTSGTVLTLSKKRR